MMPMDPNRLWAKSVRDGECVPPSATLPGHLADVTAAAERVLDATGEDQLAALGVDPATLGRFRRCVLLAAAVHDLGKANDHFQGMITRQRNVRQNPQGLRHEWATILMLQPLRKWLSPAVGGDEVDFAIVEWAVAGHHPGFDHSSPPRSAPAGGGADIRLWAGHADFAAVLRDIASTFHLPEPVPEQRDECRALTGPGNVFADLAGWAKAARRRWDSWDDRPDDRKLVAVVKNCLVAADVAGSALPRDAAAAAPDWGRISRAFAAKPELGDLQRVANVKLGADAARPFQADVAASRDDVAFVKAGCGTGKTVAAYLWAARNHPNRRLYFCYPTTGTATEGFKDYLFEPDGELGGIKADLFHSRSGIDFDVILGTGDEPAAAEVQKREALDAWSTPIVACTVDAVLGLVQNNKRGLFAWPALAQSAFVFDEIHAYDDRLFGALLRFLRDLPGLPALLMTASLPDARQDALRQTLLSHRGIELRPIGGPEDMEKRPRYHQVTVAGGDPLPFIREELGRGGKVLWVSNTVGRVMDAADRATAAGLGPMIYHSRFKYVDRVERHKAVVDAFDDKHPGPALAVTSQVCEMSLDLKGCTLLVTDVAPVPALIQRLGRLNRQAKEGHPTRPFVVVEPDTHLPYTPADLDRARAWLTALPAADISQQNLADKWEQTGDQPPDLVESAWLDGGPATTVLELREASPGITVLMEEDVRRVTTGLDVARYAIPMPPPPRHLEWKLWAKCYGIPVAPPAAITYDELRGASWARK